MEALSMGEVLPVVLDRIDGTATTWREDE